MSSINAYKEFTIQSAYRGDSFFWGLMPQAGDDIVFEFQNPVELHGYRLRSGNYEHPSDLLCNTTVEIRPVNLTLVNDPSKVSASDYVAVGTNSWFILNTSKLMAVFFPRTIQRSWYS